MSRLLRKEVDAGAINMTNLKHFGISEKDARIIHYTAAARIDELFKNADYGFFEYSYKNDTSRKGAYHAFTTIEIEGYGVFDVNISPVQAIQLKDGSFLFTLEATIENPSSNSALLPSSLRGAAGKATGITERKLSAYRSFVEKEMMYIKKNAEEAGMFMKSPSGRPSRLKDEWLWCVVRTKAFKGWFGDWESVSCFREAYNRIMSMASVVSLSGKEFDRGLSPEKMAETRNEYISGFVVSGLTREETKGAVDSEAAHLGTHFYALDELSRIQQVGAAMEKSLQKFDRIVNENPKN
ncbi:MAG: hypothetical protein Q4C05_02260 [Akkermansia sp.]|nr:hypothetical protein [Akkermansia sp.]